ncbi:hypothetical protein [Nonomuraea typhae]|uniref:hypothetical protein n=1 Tax=Nonomuraea typhae TaxID=2603600 RepID=UPI0012FC7682|nr:hypothetical protein [Nonomuraea typhae]
MPDLTLPDGLLLVAEIVAQEFAGHEQHVLDAAAKGLRSRAWAILTSRGTNDDPLPKAIHDRLSGLPSLHVDNLPTLAAMAAVAALEAIAAELSGAGRNDPEHAETEADRA